MSATEGPDSVAPRGPGKRTEVPSLMREHGDKGSAWHVGTLALTHAHVSQGEAGPQQGGQILYSWSLFGRGDQRWRREWEALGSFLPVCEL